MQGIEWIDLLKTENPELETENPHLENRSLQEYLAFYGFDITLFKRYRSGFIKVENRKIFLQVLSPEHVKGTVLLVHGYLDHTGGLAKTINRLLQEGYQVAALDLPGHGLSEGAGGSIASFNEYRNAVKAAWHNMSPYCREVPLYGLGHSTGAAVLFHAACDQEIQFSRLLFAAPLYLPYRWQKIRRGLKLMSLLMPRHKRRFKKNSEDKNYRDFIKKDPLQGKFLQSDWMLALETWHSYIRECPVYDGEIHLLQGDKDTTVEWKENLLFFRRKCRNLEVTLFEGARHQLLNEHSHTRMAVESCIVQSLNRKKADGS